MINQPVAPAGQLFISAAAQHKLHRLLSALTKALAHHREGLDARERAELLAHIGHDLPGAATAAPVRHIDDDKAAVEVFDITEATRGTNHHALKLTALYKGGEPRFDLIHVVHHVVERGSFRAVDQHNKVAAILLRCVFIGQRCGEPRRSGNE